MSLGCGFQTTLARLFHPLIVSIKNYCRGTDNVILTALLSKYIKTCQLAQKQPETAQVLLQTPWHLSVLNVSINFINL